MMPRCQNFWFFSLALLSGAFALILTTAPLGAAGQSVTGGGTTNVCTARRKCGECLQGPSCVWCKDQKFLIEDNGYARCNTRTGHRGKCLEPHLVSLPPPAAEADATRVGVAATPSAGERQSTIQPTSYKIRLGVGQRINITLDYTDPGNKPLDLYYLMDLSHTMKQHKESVQRLGRELAAALKQTTSDLRIGFGSFIDKPIMPYATVADISPNTRPDDDSVPTYGFQNHLKLTSNTSQFETVVRDAKISRNLDAPEGGLDAIMQAIECQAEIGWRNDSHHVLVMSTDGSFHIAGDGKLAGLVIPNDGQCHMSAEGQYSKSTELDYPSISQVVAKIREHKAHTIFAVTRDQVALYNELSRLVPDYATTEEFDSTSSNAKQIISNQYKLIRETVQLSPEKHPILQLRYFAKCNPNDEFKADNATCHGVGPQSTLKFIVELELLKCPPASQSRQWSSYFDISPTSSTGFEKLRVHYELQCGCDCEAEDDQNPGGALDKACTNPSQGTVRCGVCHCKEGAFIGERCQCRVPGSAAANNETSLQSYLTDEKCRKSPDSSLVCSGRGKCECGECVTCQDGFSGTFCDCESGRCRAPKNNLECSGLDHGRCECDKCVCEQRYTGEHCECDTLTRNCKREGTLCSGNAPCDCNKCACGPETPNKAWGGRYCDVCIAPPNSEVCECPQELQDYISCAVLDKKLEPEEGEDTNVTEWKLVLKDDHRAQCGLKDLKFHLLEPIDFIGENEFNEPSAGRDDYAYMKKCWTKLKSTDKSDPSDPARPNCFTQLIHYVYSIATTPPSSSSAFGAASAPGPYKEALKISIRQTPECLPPPPTEPVQDPFIIVASTSGGVVLLGILTLILWKILTHFHDKREYTRFEKERRGAKWDASGNPLYSEPISTFQNPAYRE